MIPKSLSLATLLPESQAALQAIAAVEHAQWQGDVAGPNISTAHPINRCFLIFTGWICKKPSLFTNEIGEDYNLHNM